MKLWERIKNFFTEEKRADQEAKRPPLQGLKVEEKSFRSILGVADENPDEVLRKKGVKIYDEMEAKDAHLYSVYQTRKLAVSRIPWEIVPASDRQRDKDIADFVLTVIDDAKGIFSEDIFQLMDAVGKGFAVLEIVWKEIKTGPYKGKWGIEELVFHPQKYWAFKDKRFHGITESEIFFKEAGVSLKKVPWTKVIHYAYDAQDSLYGRAAFKPNYWIWWFKKESLKFWICFLEKYAGPTVIGQFPQGTPKTEQDALLEILESIQKETAVAIPDHLSVSLLEASRSAPASYRDLIDFCNAEISKAILGATQTVEEGRRGSYALSRAHSQVRQERVEADGIAIADVLQQQLVKRIVDFNFVTDRYPQILLRFPWKEQERKKRKKRGRPRRVFADLESWAPFAEEIRFGKYKMVDKRATQLEIGEITFPRKSGRFRGVSIGRDKDGFFVMTHRARSPSYESIEAIPNRVIRFIASTG